MIPSDMKLFTLVVIVLASLAAACGAPRASLSSDPAQPDLHVVVAGDSYEELAARYQVDQGALLAANGLTEPAPLEPGRLVVLPAGHAAAPAATAIPPAAVEAAEGTASESGESAPAAPGPKPLSTEWRDAQWQRANTLVEDLRAREGGVFILGGLALVGGFVALQLVIWLVRELVLMLIPLA